jgi:hypothetical protein
VDAGVKRSRRGTVPDRFGPCLRDGSTIHIVGCKAHSAPLGLIGRMRDESRTGPACAGLFFGLAGVARGAGPGVDETMVDGGQAMVSVWWVVVAFFGGGCAGILLMAIMRMAGELPEPSTASVPDLNGMPW